MPIFAVMSAETTPNLPDTPPDFNPERMMSLQKELATHLACLENCSVPARGTYTRIMELAGRYLGDYGVAWAVARCNVPAALATQGAAAITKLLATIEKKQRMARLLEIKRQTASENIDDIRNLCHRIDRAAGAWWPYASNCLERRYCVKDGIPEALEQTRGALDGLRFGLYLQAVAAWVKAQYEAWLGGRHDSGTPCPTVELTTTAIYRKWYSSHLRQRFERAACANGSTISGADLLLLTDPQLSIMAVQEGTDVPVKVDLGKYNPLVVRKILSYNNRLLDHQDRVKRYEALIAKNPLAGKGYILLIITLFIVGLIWLAGDWALWARLGATAVCIGVAWRVWRIYRLKLICAHVDSARALASEIKSMSNGI